MSDVQAASLAARIDRLPATATIWKLVWVLSIGGFFEVYDLFQMTYLPAGMVRDGIFHAGARGAFGISDQGALGAATFAGLFIGEMFVSRLADRFGRRALFTGSLLLYTAASVAMCVQSSALGVLVCRFVASCGVGAELITIGAFLSELVPKAVRGRAFAVCFAIGYLAMPVLAFVSWLWVPHAPSACPAGAGWCYSAAAARSRSGGCSRGYPNPRAGSRSAAGWRRPTRSFAGSKRASSARPAGRCRPCRRPSTRRAMRSPRRAAHRCGMPTIAAARRC